MNEPARSPSNVRFGVLGFACSLSLLTYLDRICIMRVQDDIRGDLHLGPEQMGLVFAAFGLGYTLFEVPGGWMGDAWGARRVLTRIVLWWSLFTALTGCIWWFTIDSGLVLPGWQVPIMLDSFAVLLLVRFLFGCGEAGAYPNLARVTGSWFPFKERAVTLGAIWFSARLGGAIAPLVIGRLTVFLGWRQAFWVLGAIGMVWVVLFYWWFRNTPEEMPSCNEAERELIRAGPYSWKAGQAQAGHGRPPWGQMLLNFNALSMAVASFCVSFGWYFYPTWQPVFLKDEFGIALEDSEIRTGLPFLCGAVGSLLGGWLSDRMIRLTNSRRWGRSLLGGIGFAGAGVCVLATGMVREAWQATALLCLAFFLTDIGIPPIWAVCADIGGRFAGTLAGFMNMIGAIGSVLCPALIPVLLNNFTWQEIFVILAASWFIAAIAWFCIDASKPLFPEE